MTAAPRYEAKIASDKTELWPFWFVADNEKGGVNVTNELLVELYKVAPKQLPFLSRNGAEMLASVANQDGALP